MASVNRVTLIGNLGRDPEMRYLPDGTAVANVTLACNETWKDKASGETKEHVERVRVTFFARTAEVASEYLKKGSQCYVEGSLRTRKWQDKDGQDRYTTEVRADKLVLLGSRVGGQAAEEKVAEPQQVAKKTGGGLDDIDGDMPF